MVPFASVYLDLHSEPAFQLWCKGYASLCRYLGECSPLSYICFLMPTLVLDSEESALAVSGQQLARYMTCTRPCFRAAH